MYFNILFKKLKQVLSNQLEEDPSVKKTLDMHDKLKTAFVVIIFVFLILFTLKYDGMVSVKKIVHSKEDVIVETQHSL